jgi:glutamine synthetase
MSGSSARQRAIEAVNNYSPTAEPLNFAETPAGELFGSNVFSTKVMKIRLPKEIYKSVLATVNEGAKLDSSVADVVASAMKDWAIEKGATHYTHSPDPQQRSTIAF